MFGLLPPRYYHKDRDLELKQSKLQEFVWSYWTGMCKQIGHVDAVICNGDIVDGLNYKGRGKDVLVSDYLVQCDIARQCLKMIDCGGEWIFTEGSGYHTGHNPSADEICCEMMGGEWYGWFGDADFENITMNIQHHASYSGNPGNRYNSQQQFVNNLKLQGDDADIFIRSHTHNFAYSGSSSSITINTPCWKGLDGHMGLKSQQRPDNGWVLFKVDGSDYSWDHTVFKIPKQLFAKHEKY